MLLTVNEGATSMDEMLDEGAYDRLRLRQWLAGKAGGFSRRDLLRLTAAVGAGLAGAGAAGAPARAAVPAPGRRLGKPLPPHHFNIHPTNSKI
jgi:hypothetical protein